MSVRSLTFLVLAAAVAAGCATALPPLDATRARLAEARTPEARLDAVVERLAGTGVAPLARGQVRPSAGPVFTYGTPSVVGGIVPGQQPVRRLDLVTLAAPLDSPALAETIEAARALVAARPHGRPRRSVLVALWPAGLVPAEGLARIRAVPVWPDSLRGATVVVGDAADADAQAVGGAVGEALVARIVATVLAAADAVPADAVPADTLASPR